MDDELLRLYETELTHLRSHAADFAQREEYRTIARRLRLGTTEPLRDPFVEWLLQGYAFLAARIRRKLDAEFPRFTQNLLSIAYPHLTAPTPSLAVVRLDPRPDPALLADGALMARGSRLTMARATRSRTRRAIYTTGRAARLWPLEVADLRYLPDAAAMRRTGVGEGAPAGLALTLATTVPGVGLGSAGADALDLFLPDVEGGGPALYEALTAACRAGRALVEGRPRIDVAPLGLDRTDPETGEPDTLLPYGPRSFDGYRLLQEFFALPARFQFVRLSGLARAFAAAGSAERAEIVLPLDRAFPDMTAKLGAEAARTNCVPVVNLFEKRADDIRLTARRTEHPIVPDAGNPLSFEVHSVTGVRGLTAARREIVYRPFFAPGGFGADRSTPYYQIVRRRRARSDMGEIRDNAAEAYRGTEAFVSLTGRATGEERVNTLALDLLCTNRHLPLIVAAGGRLTSDLDLGWRGIELVAGPSAPREGLTEGRRLWDAVSHLSLNHLSLIEAGDAGDESSGGESRGAEALRQLLRLYASEESDRARALIDALEGAEARSAVRRAPPLERRPGDAHAPVSFTRGLVASLTFAPGAAHAPVLAAVLSRVLAGHAEVNSVVETEHREPGGRLRARFAPRAGTRVLL